MDLVLRQISAFAANPTEELVGRDYWQMFIRSGSRSHQRKVYTVDDTMCVVTKAALLTSFFGPSFAKTMELTPPKADFQSQIEEHACFLRNDGTTTLFFAYDFTLAHAYGAYPDHTLVVLHSLDENANSQFRLFQSYLEVYSLKEFLEEHDNLLDQEGFKGFLQGLIRFDRSLQWTEDMGSFFTKFFHSAAHIPIGSRNPYKNALSFKCAEATYEDFLAQTAAFTAFRSAPDFPELQSWN